MWSVPTCNARAGVSYEDGDLGDFVDSCPIGWYTDVIFRIKIIQLKIQLIYQ